MKLDDAIIIVGGKDECLNHVQIEKLIYRFFGFCTCWPHKKIEAPINPPIDLSIFYYFDFLKAALVRALRVEIDLSSETVIEF